VPNRLCITLSSWLWRPSGVDDLVGLLRTTVCRNVRIITCQNSPSGQLLRRSSCHQQYQRTYRSRSTLPVHMEPQSVQFLPPMEGHLGVIDLRTLQKSMQRTLPVICRIFAEPSRRLSSRFCSAFYSFRSSDHQIDIPT
jgi:hypothetical protein